MRTVECNPVASIFPLMGEEELRGLAEDIRAQGLREPIVVDSDGRILDGRNRYRACRLAGVEPSFESFDGDDPVAFVVSLNLKRRHLNESQRAMVAARLANLGIGDNQFTREDAPIGGTSQGQAAELLNVSRRSVQRAHQVIDHGTPELVQAVEQDSIPVSTAAGIAKEEPERQREAVSERLAVLFSSESNEWYTPNTVKRAIRLQVEEG